MVKSSSSRDLRSPKRYYNPPNSTLRNKRLEYSPHSLSISSRSSPGAGHLRRSNRSRPRCSRCCHRSGNRARRLVPARSFRRRRCYPADLSPPGTPLLRLRGKNKAKRYGFRRHLDPQPIPPNGWISPYFPYHQRIAKALLNTQTPRDGPLGESQASAGANGR